jgi:hypothetical protein
LIIPYFQQEKSSQNPENENSAPAEGSCDFFHCPLLDEEVAYCCAISSALIPNFNRVKMVFGYGQDGNFDKAKKRP